MVKINITVPNTDTVYDSIIIDMANPDKGDLGYLKVAEEMGMMLVLA